VKNWTPRVGRFASTRGNETPEEINGNNAVYRQTFLSPFARLHRVAELQPLVGQLSQTYGDIATSTLPKKVRQRAKTSYLKTLIENFETMRTVMHEMSTSFPSGDEKGFPEDVVSMLKYYELYGLSTQPGQLATAELQDSQTGSRPNTEVDTVEKLVIEFESLNRHLDDLRSHTPRFEEWRPLHEISAEMKFLTNLPNELDHFEAELKKLARRAAHLIPTHFVTGDSIVPRAHDDTREKIEVGCCELLHRNVQAVDHICALTQWIDDRAYPSLGSASERKTRHETSNPSDDDVDP
jgi:hypothetical protein